MANTQQLFETAENHLLIALDEFKPLPRTHEELIEKLREYFEDQKVEVFSKIVANIGDDQFRAFIADVIIKSGKYYRDENDQVRVKE